MIADVISLFVNTFQAPGSEAVIFPPRHVDQQLKEIRVLLCK